MIKAEFSASLHQYSSVSRDPSEMLFTATVLFTLFLFIFSLLAYFRESVVNKRPSRDQHPWSTTVSNFCQIHGSQKVAVVLGLKKPLKPCLSILSNYLILLLWLLLIVNKSKAFETIILCYWICHEDVTISSFYAGLLNNLDIKKGRGVPFFSFSTCPSKGLCTALPASGISDRKISTSQLFSL